MGVRRRATKKDGLIFKDREGNIFTFREVMFVDKDSPGPDAFLGYIIKESYEGDGCWIEVRPLTPIQQALIEKICEAADV